MNVLVIGGAGFVGSHLVERLLADGHAVDVADDLSTGSLANLRAAREMPGRLRIDNIDATSNGLAELVALRTPEVIYHLALMPPGVGDAHVSAVGSMLGLLEAARACPGTKVVVAVAATRWYGEVPAREQPVKESNTGEPLQLEGVIAHSILDVLSFYRSHHAVEFSLLVLGSVYGSRQRPEGGLVAAFVDAAARGVPPAVDARVTRDLVFIDDTVDALARAASRGGGLVLNVGTGRPTTLGELWAMMSPTPLSRPTEPADEPARLVLSPTRSRIHLGWSAWTDLPTGIAALGEPS